MHVCVGLVFKLSRQKPAVGFGEFDGLLDHTRAFLFGRGQHNFGPQKTHHLAALDAEVFRHHQDQRITLLGTDHGQPDTGVAAGRFDDCLSRFQLAGALSVLDDPQCQAVLY